MRIEIVRWSGGWKTLRGWRVGVHYEELHLFLLFTPPPPSLPTTGYDATSNRIILPGHLIAPRVFAPTNTQPQSRYRIKIRALVPTWHPARLTSEKSVLFLLLFYIYIFILLIFFFSRSIYTTLIYLSAFCGCELKLLSKACPPPPPAKSTQNLCRAFINTSHADPPNFADQLPTPSFSHTYIFTLR